MTGADYDLAGYIRLAAQGLTMPCYRRGPHSNAWYRAVCQPALDHGGAIAEFEMIDDAEIVLIPEEQRVQAGTGSPWIDVFLWDDQLFIGTPVEIWENLETHHATLFARAPLSLLDIATFVETAPGPDIAGRAFAYIASAHGAQLASRWRNDTFLRNFVRWQAARLRAKLRRNVNLKITVTGDVLNATGDVEALNLFRPTLLQYAEALNLQLRSSVDAAEPTDFEHELRPRALIVVRGARARQIAKQFRDPDWAARFPEDDERRRRPVMLDLDKPHKAKQRRGSSIHVTESWEKHDFFQEDEYAAIVLLVDDDLRSDPHSNIRRPENGVLLLAPALPQDTPAGLLVDEKIPPELTHQFDAIIDTSLARSPFCAFAANRSLERRVGDIVLGAAYLATNPAVRREITAFSAQTKLPLLTFTAPIPGAIRRSVSSRRAALEADLDLQIASESTWARSPVGRQSEGLPFVVVSSAPDSREGIIRLRERSSDFADFAESLYSPRERRAKPVNSLLIAALDYPFQAAVIETGRGDIVVCAEMPTLEAVRSAQDEGTPIVRYTDEETFDALSAEFSAQRMPLVPRQVRIKGLVRLPENARLVNRGVDQRDVVRLNLKEIQSLPTAVRDAEPRRLLTPKEQQSPEATIPAVVPRTRLRDLAGSDEEVWSLIRRSEPPTTGKRAFTRPADVSFAWSSPPRGCRRFAIRDGALPIEMRIVGEGEVASQHFLIFDGDWSAAGLFLSRPFDLWARATARMPSGWGQRFSVISTFETFPLPKGMKLSRRGDGASLRLSADDKTMASAKEARDVVEELLMDTQRRKETELRRPREHEVLDDFFLRLYGLRRRSTDLDVLERLVVMNRSHSA